MSKLKFSCLERMVKHDNFCVALYYVDAPNRLDVITDLESLQGKFDLNVDLSDPLFGYVELPTKLSEAAGWKRYECYPVG